MNYDSLNIHQRHKILPHFKNPLDNRDDKEYIHAIDSRHRDYTLYPRASNYRIKLDRQYENVKSVELLIANIPNTDNNINNTNNNIWITGADGVQRLIKFKNGKYTNESLLDYLNGKSDGNIFYKFAENEQYFNFSIDKNTKKLRIQSNKEFTFNNFNYNNQLDNILNKNNKLDIKEYFKQINYKSVDNTLGFRNKIYKATVAKYNLNECNDTDSGEIDEFEIISDSSENTIIYDGYDGRNISTNLQIKDLSGNMDMRQIYKKYDYLTINKSGTDNKIYQIYSLLNKDRFGLVDVNEPFEEYNTSYNKIKTIYTVTADFAMNLDCSDYLILDIPQFHCIKSNTVSLNDSFSIFSLDNKCKYIINYDRSGDEIKYFKPLLNRLSEIDIRFLRYDNTEFDFNGGEHMFTLKIICKN